METAAFLGIFALLFNKRAPGLSYICFWGAVITALASVTL